MDVIPSVSSASWRFLCEYDCQRWQSSLASGYSSCAIDGYDEAPSCSSFAPGSSDIDVIFHVHCTKPVWCVTAVSILHLEMLELMLCISDGVMRSKGALEFSYEVDPAVHPPWVVSWITRVEEVWFKLFQRHTF